MIHRSVTFHALIQFLHSFIHYAAWKQPNVVSIIGLLVVICGEALRKLAMWTAGTNFNHYVRHFREDGHQLVTHGIFGYFRHPAYVGWFYWSVATQVGTNSIQHFEYLPGGTRLLCRMLRGGNQPFFFIMFSRAYMCALYLSTSFWLTAMSYRFGVIS